MKEGHVPFIFAINSLLNRYMTLKLQTLKSVILRNLHVFILLIVVSGCSVTGNLDDGEYLLKRNRIIIHSDSGNINFTAGELERYHQQRPNKRVFRIYPFYAAAWNFGDAIHIPDSAGFSPLRKWGWKRKNNFRLWVMKNGEAPVVLDTSAADRTLVQLGSFLVTRGHFNAIAERDIRTWKKKASVTYNIQPGPGHRIREINTNIPSTGIRLLYGASSGQSLIKKGAPYDEKVLQNERDRITRILKDSGYYHFNKAYIVVEVDTFMPGNFLDIYLKILDQSFFDENNRDSVYIRQHLPARIRNIYINPEYEGPFVKKDMQILPVEAAVASKGGSKSVYYLYESEYHLYNPQVLINNIFIEPGQLYNLRDVELTYLYLSDLSNFSNISITFTDVAGGETREDNVVWLDCHINLTRLHRQSYEIRLDATNRAGDPGVNTYLVYQNRNVFKGADVVSLAFKGAMEVQKILDKDQVETTIFDNLPFNTLELGADIDFRFPRFVSPVRLSGLSKTFKPRTRFSGGINFQERPDYKRYLLKVTSGYDWQLRSNIIMALNPFEINAVSISPVPSFIEKIKALDDQRLRNSYSDHLITAITLNMMIDNQGAPTRRSYSFLRFSFESAGLFVNTFRRSLNYPVNSEGIALIFNIPYAQYLRSDVDYRQFFRLRQKDQVIAARLYLGLGNPYGNMNVLPFEKSFYVGGANGIRAWPVRTIGPGSYSDQLNLIRFDRTGDFGLETSVEYRFPMYGNFNGALFLDAGNVWLKNKNDKYPGGEFVFDRFFRELAVGTGLGLRIVTFFVIRVDAGIKIHDPSKPDGERWMFDEIKLRRINWNFGIGYSI